jgi:hypothetical protein
MPNPNAIVDLVVRITPPVEKSGVELLREHPNGFYVDFEGQRSARLPASERAGSQIEILDGLRRLRAPVYVDVHPDTHAITRLLIPYVARIHNIVNAEADQVGIELEPSHGYHTLSRSNSDFDDLLKMLQWARGSKAWLAVTETDEHEIIDARPYTPLQEPPASENKVRSFGDWLRRILWFPCRILACIRCVSARKAEAMFNLVATQSCNPLTVPAPCIPFLYPDDGCWGRASEMCRLMIAQGVTPKKVWIYGSGFLTLRVNTRNNPQCHVSWNWHVAPTLCVRRRGLCGVETQVIDPALFPGPVSMATWKGVQSDPAAQLVDTDASVFYRSANGTTQTDPGYVQTAQVLATYRLRLKNRSVQVGPPPYSNCP